MQLLLVPTTDCWLYQADYSDTNHFISILTLAINNSSIINNLTTMQAHPGATDHLLSQFFIAWLHIQQISTATNSGDGHQN